MSITTLLVSGGVRLTNNNGLGVLESLVAIVLVVLIITDPVW
jgi:hypothetical protein